MSCTWADIVADYRTWSDVVVNYETWADVAICRPTGVDIDVASHLEDRRWDGTLPGLERLGELEARDVLGALEAGTRAGDLGRRRWEGTL